MAKIEPTKKDFRFQNSEELISSPDFCRRATREKWNFRYDQLNLALSKDEIKRIRSNAHILWACFLVGMSGYSISQCFFVGTFLAGIKS